MSTCDDPVPLWDIQWSDIMKDSVWLISFCKIQAFNWAILYTRCIYGQAGVPPYRGQIWESRYAVRSPGHPARAIEVNLVAKKSRQGLEGLECYQPTARPSGMWVPVPQLVSRRLNVQHRAHSDSFKGQINFLSQLSLIKHNSHGANAYVTA